MRCLRSRPPPLVAGFDKNRRAQHASSEAGGGKGKYGTVKNEFGISFVGKRFQEDVIKPEKR